MKFGGSALQTAHKIRHVTSIVESHVYQQPVLVLSAMGTTTDNLIAAGCRAAQQRQTLLVISSYKNEQSFIENFHRDIMAQLELPATLIDDLFCELDSVLQQIFLHEEVTPQQYDHLLSFGERFSVRIFSAYLNKYGIPSTHFDGWDIGILSTSDFGRAEILPETYERIPLALQGIKGAIPVITGFIAKDREGNVTTLGRGGSDLTASVVGTALMASEVQLWKDVNGILSADPHLASTAQSISHLSFVEAAELAHFGAKVLHPASVWPAMCKAIPVRVKNYQNPSHPGTLIKNQSPHRKGSVVAIAHKSRQALIRITAHPTLGHLEFLASVFQAFHEFKLPIDVIATSHNEISAILDQQYYCSSLVERLQHVATVATEHSKSIVSLIGTNNHSSEFCESVLHALNIERIAPQTISYSASRCNTTLMIDDAELNQCVEALHRNFF